MINNQLPNLLKSCNKPQLLNGYLRRGKWSKIYLLWKPYEADLSFSWEHNEKKRILFWRWLPVSLSICLCFSDKDTSRTAAVSVFLQKRNQFSHKINLKSISNLPTAFLQSLIVHLHNALKQFPIFVSDIGDWLTCNNKKLLSAFENFCPRM